MAKEPNTQLTRVIQVFKANGDDTWAQSFGFKVYEIPAWVIEKHGNVVNANEPDVLGVFEGQLINCVKNEFGL